MVACDAGSANHSAKWKIHFFNIRHCDITLRELPGEITHCTFSICFFRKGSWQPPAFRVFPKTAHHRININKLKPWIPCYLTWSGISSESCSELHAGWQACEMPLLLPRNTNALSGESFRTVCFTRLSNNTGCACDNRQRLQYWRRPILGNISIKCMKEDCPVGLTRADENVFWNGFAIGETDFSVWAII